MATQAPTNIYKAVEPTAAKYGIPDWLWQDIANVESGFNPGAVGDNGTSFGLFQLHIGGQLPPQYYNNSQAVLDPTLNAEIALPSIAQAWNSLGSSFDNSLGWWEKFASQSGHPGGTPGENANVLEAQQLMQGYSSSGSVPGTGDPCLGCGPVGSSAYTACHIALAAKVGPIPSCAQQGIQQNQQQIASSGLGILDTINAWVSDKNNWIRTGLVVGGIFIILIGVKEFAHIQLPK